jgi:hypothetical protein
MTIEERDQVVAERTDAIRNDRVRPARAARYPDARSPPTVKIIDRVKAYFQKKDSDDPSAEQPLDEAATPAPAQQDAATQEQNSEDKTPVVPTADETSEPGPVAEPAPEPITEPAVEPVAEPAPEPAAGLTPEPVAEPAAEPTAEVITEPTVEPAVEPVVEPTTEPVVEPATVPATASGVCPRCGAVGDAPCTTPAGKPTKQPHKGRV